MEKILVPAAAKNAASVMPIYPVGHVDLSGRKLEVEGRRSRTERRRDKRHPKALEDLFASARTGQTTILQAKVDALKSSLMKVYLKRGWRHPTARCV